MLSPSLGDQQRNPAPFATVAMAGHVFPNGEYCDCGSRADCICGPGEQTASNQATTDAGTATLGNQGANGGDAGAGLMLLTLALMLALRLRF
jgi:hypothetical protein